MASHSGTVAEAPKLDDGLFVACGLAWCASLIHVEAAVEHLSEYILYGAFFALLAPLQFAWGIAVCRQPSRRLLAAGGVLGILVATLWLVSRTCGLPIGPEPWQPEPVGPIDAIATADEVVTALLILGGARWRLSKPAVIAAGVSLILLSSVSLVVLGRGH